MPIQIGAASQAHLPAVLSLLESAELPVAGVEQHVSSFLVARDGDEIVGCIGLEAYGNVALLRSLAVSVSGRSRGTGRALVDRLLVAARDRGIDTMYLLTTTADRYFPRFGFEVVPREDADERLARSEEFRGACPDSAVCMRRALARSPRSRG